VSRNAATAPAERALSGEWIVCSPSSSINSDNFYVLYTCSVTLYMTLNTCVLANVSLRKKHVSTATGRYSFDVQRLSIGACLKLSPASVH